MYKLRGKILNSRTETITAKDGKEFEKMLFTIEESDTGFNHVHQFEIFGKESIEIHKDSIKQERYVNIDFYIKSNEWKDRFFNTLMVKGVRLEDDIVMPNMKSNNDVPF